MRCVRVFLCLPSCSLGRAPLTHLREHFEMRMLSDMRQSLVKTPMSSGFSVASIASRRAIWREIALGYA